MNTILILSSILFLWFVWNFFWVTIFNEFIKIQLLKLKTETNQWFEEKGYSSNHAANELLQKDLDFFISSVEFFKLGSFLLYIKFGKKKKTTQKLLDEENYSDEIKTKIIAVKSTISTYITLKMLLCNIITFALFLISFVILFGITLYRLVKKIIVGQCRITFHQLSSSLVYGFVFTIFIGVISLPFISKISVQGYFNNITIKDVYKHKPV